MTQPPIRLTVIHNPVAGARRKINVPHLVSQSLHHGSLESNVADLTIVATEGPKHATELARKAAADGADVVLAAGGDGTLNEVAQGLLHTNVRMGILPLGSGNGLARHLGVPLRLPEAVTQAVKAPGVLMDGATLNGTPFFCTAGVGYDAEVARTFASIAEKRGRGLVNYLFAGWIAYNNFKPEVVELVLDGVSRTVPVFSLTVANAGQFGNNAIISTQADVTDGLLDVCIVHPFPWLKGAEMTARLFAGTLPKSALYETVRAREVTIRRKQAGWLHYDGEPRQMPAELNFKVQPGQLMVQAYAGRQQIRQVA